MNIIVCPNCGAENEYDPEEQDVIMCDDCDQLIFVPEEGFPA
jgi:DNA-directed RNA polymerase subunit RPC12/RpoP